MNNPHRPERRRIRRQNISFYMTILENQTRKIIGYLVDISPMGLSMDAKMPVQIDQKYSLCLDFMEEIVGKDSLVLTTRCKWCRQDGIQPNVFNVGFEFLNLSPQDLEVIKQVAQKYSTG